MISQDGNIFSACDFVTVELKSTVCFICEEMGVDLRAFMFSEL